MEIKHEVYIHTTSITAIQREEYASIYKALGPCMINIKRPLMHVSHATPIMFILH